MVFSRLVRFNEGMNLNESSNDCYTSKICNLPLNGHYCKFFFTSYYGPGKVEI